MILDTSFLIDLLRNEKGAIAKAKELDEKDEAVFACTVSVFELWQGVHDAPEHERESVLQLLNALGLHVLDFESAKHAGEIFDVLRREGQQLEPEDCLIAGTALSHNEHLLTRNVKHFTRIKGLLVQSY